LEPEANREKKFPAAANEGLVEYNILAIRLFDRIPLTSRERREEMRLILLILALLGFRYWSAQQGQLATAEAKAQVAQEAAKTQPPAEDKVKVPAKTLAADLCPPVALQAAGKVINVEVGHAAPLVADLGDGKLSMLVGQYGGGKLRAYPMQKDGDGYKLGEFAWVQAGTGNCSVPAG
jgi:hypothetical protein